MEHAQVVSPVSLISYDQALLVEEPSEDSLYLPTSLVAPQRAPVLGLFQVPAVWGDHLDAPHVVEQHVELVGVVRLVADEPDGQLLHPSLGEGDFDESRFMRASTSSPKVDRKAIAVCNDLDFSTHSSVRFASAKALFVCQSEASVDEALRQVQLGASQQILGQGAQHLFQRSVPTPVRSTQRVPFSKSC